MNIRCVFSISCDEDLVNKLQKRTEEVTKKAEEISNLNQLLEEKVFQRTAELTESEKKFRTLYESSSDAVMLLDENGFFDCNAATLQMFSVNSREAIAPRSWCGTACLRRPGCRPGPSA